MDLDFLPNNSSSFVDSALLRMAMSSESQGLREQPGRECLRLSCSDMEASASIRYQEHNCWWEEATFLHSVSEKRCWCRCQIMYLGIAPCQCAGLPVLSVLLYKCNSLSRGMFLFSPIPSLCWGYSKGLLFPKC